MKTTIKLLTLAAAFSAMVTGCEDVEKVTPVPNKNSSNLSANFLFMNASPDAPALDIYVNNKLLGPALLKGGASAAYVNLGIPSNSTFSNTRFSAKGNSQVIGGVLGSNDLIFRGTNTSVSNFTAANGGYYTVIAVDTIYRPKPLRSFDDKGFGVKTYYSPVNSFTGVKKVGTGDTTIQLSSNNSLATYNLVVKYTDVTHPNPLIEIGLVPLGSSDVGGLRFLVVTDYNATTLPASASGKFTARFINASPDAGSASCKIGSVTVPGQITNPMSVAGGLSPSVGSRSMSVAFTKDVNTAGSYAASVTVGAKTYTTPAINFANGGIYTVVLSGSKAKNTLGVTVITNK